MTIFNAEADTFYPSEEKDVTQEQMTPFEASLHAYSFFGIHGVDEEMESEDEEGEVPEELKEHSLFKMFEEAKHQIAREVQQEEEEMRRRAEQFEDEEAVQDLQRKEQIRKEREEQEQRIQMWRSQFAKNYRGADRIQETPRRVAPMPRRVQPMDVPLSALCPYWMSYHNY